MWSLACVARLTDGEGEGLRVGVTVKSPARGRPLPCVSWPCVGSSAATGREYQSVQDANILTPHWATVHGHGAYRQLQRQRLRLRSRRRSRQSLLKQQPQQLLPRRLQQLRRLAQQPLRRHLQCAVHMRLVRGNARNTVLDMRFSALRY